MNEKKIVVPEGMLMAAVEAVQDRSEFGFSFLDNEQRETVIAQTKDTLEAALRWLSEHPVVMSEQAWEECFKAIPEGPYETSANVEIAQCVEWQRRCFLAPHPEAPEEITEIRDLTAQFDVSTHDGYKACVAAVEAFRRGQKSKDQK